MPWAAPVVDALPPVTATYSRVGAIVTTPDMPMMRMTPIMVPRLADSTPVTVRSPPSPDAHQERIWLVSSSAPPMDSIMWLGLIVILRLVSIPKIWCQNMSAAPPTRKMIVPIAPSLYPAGQALAHHRAFWRRWFTQGVILGARDGCPDLSFFDLEATYWRARRTENLLLVHYNDLKADLEGEMRRIAGFLSIEPPAALWPRLVEAATFEAMKQHGETFLVRARDIFEGGADRFFFKGTNGRWRDEMTAEELALYEQDVSRFTPGLAAWVEHGRLIAGDPRTRRIEEP